MDTPPDSQRKAWARLSTLTSFVSRICFFKARCSDSDSVNGFVVIPPAFDFTRVRLGGVKKILSTYLVRRPAPIRNHGRLVVHDPGAIPERGPGAAPKAITQLNDGVAVHPEAIVRIQGILQSHHPVAVPVADGMEHRRPFVRFKQLWRHILLDGRWLPLPQGRGTAWPTRGPRLLKRAGPPAPPPCFLLPGHWSAPL